MTSAAAILYLQPGPESRRPQRISGVKRRIPLPYKFDLSVYEDIEELGLIAHIERVGAAFYNRELQPAEPA